jgi:hypothetical protein
VKVSQVDELKKGKEALFKLVIRAIAVSWCNLLRVARFALRNHLPLVK